MYNSHLALTPHFNHKISESEQGSNGPWRVALFSFGAINSCDGLKARLPAILWTDGY